LSFRYEIYFRTSLRTKTVPRKLLFCFFFFFFLCFFFFFFRRSNLPPDVPSSPAWTFLLNPSDSFLSEQGLLVSAGVELAFLRAEVFVPTPPFVPIIALSYPAGRLPLLPELGREVWVRRAGVSFVVFLARRSQANGQSDQGTPFSPRLFRLPPSFPCERSCPNCAPQPGFPNGRMTLSFSTKHFPPPNWRNTAFLSPIWRRVKALLPIVPPAPPISFP